MITELTTSSVALAVHDLSKQMKKIDIVVGRRPRADGDACQPYGFHWATTPMRSRSAPAARWWRPAAIPGSS